MSHLPVKPGTPAVRLDEGDRWVSCGVREFGPVGHVRHIVSNRGVTTVCGNTATHTGVWRANIDKPRCASCVARYSTRKARR